MKKFVQFIEDGGVATTATAGVAGAGDNPQKIVPVFRKRKSPSMGLLTRKLV